MTAPVILAGLVNTLVMTACAMALGLALGVLAAVMTMSPAIRANRATSGPSTSSAGGRACCGVTWATPCSPRSAR